MTVEDSIKFYEDEKNLYTSEDVENYCEIVKVVANPNENVKTKPKIIKAQKIVLGKKYKEERCQKIGKEENKHKKVQL